MQFIKIEPRPGVYTDGTDYTAEGTWYSVDKVRFRKGFAEKLGGWKKFINDSFLGSCRKIHNWAVNSGASYVSVGTHVKLYQSSADGADPADGSYTDITPIRATGTVTEFTTTSGSSLVVVTDPAHGASDFDYVTISGVPSAVDGIPAASLNREHQISALGDLTGADPKDKYIIQIDAEKATAGATTASSALAEYQISTGLDVLGGSAAIAWGGQGWGVVPWGGTGTSAEDSLRQWSLDNYGDDLLATVRNGRIYYWDESAGGRAVALNDRTRTTTTLLGTAASGGTTVTVNSNGHGAEVGDQIVVSAAGVLRR
jgi:hypothetical protein